MSYNIAPTQLALSLEVDNKPLDSAVNELRYHISAMKHFALTIESSVGRINSFHKTLALLQPLAELGWLVGTYSDKFRTTPKQWWIDLTPYNPIAWPVDDRSNETIVDIALDYKRRLEAITIRLRASLPSMTTKLDEKMFKLVQDHKFLYYTIHNELL